MSYKIVLPAMPILGASHVAFITDVNNELDLPRGAIIEKVTITDFEYPDVAVDVTLDIPVPLSSTLLASLNTTDQQYALDQIDYLVRFAGKVVFTGLLPTTIGSVQYFVHPVILNV